MQKSNLLANLGSLNAFKIHKRVLSILCLFLLLLPASCGLKVNYGFTGANVGTAETFQVNFFNNFADQSPGSTIEPGLDRLFTNSLQDLISSLTSLSLTGEDGDLIYEGEIVEYRVAPITASANQTAAQNRLTISVNVRFFNNKKEDSDFEQRFSFFFDFDGTQLLESVKDQAQQVIFDRITQDIFNRSLADW